MKKKIVSLVLAFCVLSLCVVLTACKDNPTRVIEAALEKTKNLDSMNAEMNMEINFSMEGMTMSVPLTAHIKAKDMKSESPIMSSAITMTMLEQSLDMELYQEGEWAYILVDDMKYKTNIKNGKSEYDYTDNINDMLQDIPKDLLKNVEAVKGDDGSVTMTVSIPDEYFAEIYGDFLEDLNSDSGIGDGEVKISDAVVKITAAGGYISVYDMEFVMEITVDGTTTTADVKANVSYKNPGEEVDITPPENYKDFEELDLSGLS